MNKKDRFTGVLFGQAIGDALGLGSEFMSKEEVLRYYPNGLSSYSQIIQDDHRCRWQQGMWTDDTEMMLCIADALIASGGEVNLNLIANNFKAWFEGNPLGIGRHTYNVLCFKDYVNAPIQAAEIVWTLYRKRSCAPLAVIDNLRELEYDGDEYEGLEYIWPDIPTNEEYFGLDKDEN